jgi:hypothetical protein
LRGEGDGAWVRRVESRQTPTQERRTAWNPFAANFAFASSHNALTPSTEEEVDGLVGDDISHRKSPLAHNAIVVFRIGVLLVVLLLLAY